MADLIKYSKHIAVCTYAKWWVIGTHRQTQNYAVIDLPGKMFASSYLPRPPFKVPRVRFVATALVIRQSEEKFLLEERRTIRHFQSRPTL